jgi:hypothetical protein
MRTILDNIWTDKWVSYLAFYWNLVKFINFHIKKL